MLESYLDANKLSRKIKKSYPNLFTQVKAIGQGANSGKPGRPTWRHGFSVVIINTTTGAYREVSSYEEYIKRPL